MTLRKIYDSAGIHNPGPTKDEVEDDGDAEVSLWMSWFFEFRYIM